MILFIDMGKNKHINNESASFNLPDKKEREKSNFEEFITKLLGKVIFRKESFFGLDVQKMVIIVTPSYKIASVISSPKKWSERYPQKRQDILDPEIAKQWAKDNGFEITFVAPTPQLKSRLHNSFGDVMVADVVAESKKVKVNVNEEIVNSGLPDFVKDWAKDNPEKFMENIKRIKELLK
jgi:hypothetical protein